MPREEKVLEVKKIKEILTEKPNVFLLSFSKVNVKDETILRQKIKETGSLYFVSKNTLIKRALNEMNISGLDKFLEGPTAIVASKDRFVEVAKILKDYQGKNPFFYFKAGIIEKRIESAESLKALADLPPREELIPRFIFLISSPIQRLVNVISAPINNLMRALVLISERK